MDFKKALIGTIGGTAMIAGLAGGLAGKKGLDLGMKIGFGAGITAGVIGSTIFVLGKNKIKGKCCLSVKEEN